jgi:hypothetical protein
LLGHGWMDGYLVLVVIGHGNGRFTRGSQSGY